MVELIDFAPHHAKAFREISEEWILGNKILNDNDLKVMANPQAEIIDKGGEIIMALLDGEIIGTAGLLEKEGKFEMVKLGVTHKAQGHGIGKMLSLAIIERAKKRGATQLFLETNQKLEKALGLYEKLGFKKLNYKGLTPLCDLQMVLSL